MRRIVPFCIPLLAAAWIVILCILIAPTTARAGQGAINAPATAGAGQVTFVMNDDDLSEEMAALVRDSQLFEFLAEHINGFFKLPEDLTIVIRTCDEANAFYDPETRELIMCSELFDYLYEQAKGMEEENADQLFLDVMFFTTLHEFGHALIDVYNLPITGREEDVADQISTWFSLETIGENEEECISSPLNAAYFFAVEYDEAAEGDSELAFWDSHSLDPQRFYNIICWVDGYDPELTEKILEDNIHNVLPEEREVYCAEEYGKMRQAFAHLLNPHLATPIEN